MKDEETHQLLLDLLAPTVKGWIGGKKIDGKWTWVDGTPFAWTGGWGAGSPSGDGSYMELIGQTYNGWNDLGAVINDPRDTLCILTAIDGNWGAWSTWSDCTATCGGGTRTKTRECNDPPPEFDGADCQGLSNKELECNTHKCPIDGNWGAWGTWSECSATCGGGIQTKTRECNDPPPEFNGADCPGTNMRESGCNTQKCAGTFFSEINLYASTILL